MGSGFAVFITYMYLTADRRHQPLRLQAGGRGHSRHVYTRYILYQDLWYSLDHYYMQ